MIPYLLVYFISIVIFSILEIAIGSNRKTNWFYSVLLIIPIFVFSIIYAGVIGSDLMHYKNQYEIADEFILEPGFSFVMIFFKYMGLDYFGFSKVLAIIHLLLYVFISIKLKDPLLFFIFYIGVFFLNFHFNAIRNSLALLMIAVFYVRAQKISMPTLILATSIHYSSLIAIAIQKAESFCKSKFAIGSVFVLIFTLLFFNINLEDFKTYFYYSGYLDRITVEKAIYPALILKLLMVFIFSRNGCSQVYLVLYMILVLTVHFVTPDANRICDIVLFLALLETCWKKRITKFRSSAIIISCILILSALLIPWTDCQAYGVDHWCLND